jgi:hypothetical protein
MKNDNLGRCPLCGQICDVEQDVTQLHGGRDGFAHLDCLQEAAEDLVSQEDRSADRSISSRAG